MYYCINLFLAFNYSTQLQGHASPRFGILDLFPSPACGCGGGSWLDVQNELTNQRSGGPSERICRWNCRHRLQQLWCGKHWWSRMTLMNVFVILICQRWHFSFINNDICHYISLSTMTMKAMMTSKTASQKIRFSLYALLWQKMTVFFSTITFTLKLKQIPFCF